MNDDKGQALALGTVGLLLLAIGMYMTASLGRHVQQKIHVQTTADATALSLATMEAQSLNYIAFANRAQVAHYVTVLNMQGYVSYLSSIEHMALMTTAIANAVEKSLVGCTLIGGACAALVELMKAVKDGMWNLYKIVREVIKTVDPALGLINPALERLNHALWISEMTMADIVVLHLGLGGQEVFQTMTQQNDPLWANTTPALLVNEALAFKHNIPSYSATFDPAGGKPFGVSSGLTDQAYAPGFTDDSVIRAQRVMTEVVNATRYDEALLNRPLLPFSLGTHTLKDFGQWINDTFHAKLGGESKLTHASADTKNQLEAIFAPQGVGSLSRGEVAASNDEWLWGHGSIWSKAGPTRTSKHCRAENHDTIPEGGDLAKAAEHLLKGETFDSLYGACASQTSDPNHSFAGITPYMLYQAGGDPTQPTGDFHQPSVMVWMYKSAEQAGFEKAVKFSWSTKNNTASVDTTLGRSIVFQALTGVHAVARAEAYYHRPGNWAEPPNLFNPFWRARLMPVRGDTQTAPDGSLLPLDTLIEQNLIFH